jgi:hypothetical protein
MDKTKPDEALSGRPIAKKIVSKMKRHGRGKVVDIKNVIDGHAMAEELQKTVVSQNELASFDPAHAVYVYTQNQVSVMSEQLTTLKEMAPFADIISRAEDLYMPSAPPMSPLTTSYFTCWAFFDACTGPANETIGTTILEVGAAFGMHPELLRLIRLMQDSRMGFYIHRGREGNVTILEDLVTTAVYRAIVPAGYSGRKNENWYVRLLPPITAGGQEHVVFTTPYLVVHPDFDVWLEYFRRTLPATAGFGDYKRHMKYGPTREYWNDYVFEAYVNHRAEAIYLAGLPDIPESRPHSEVSQVNGWKGPDDFIIQR